MLSSVTSDNLKFSIVRDISTLSLSLCHFIIHLWLVRLFLLTHVLRPLHFKHRIKGLLRPSTNANLCFLKFELTNCSCEIFCQSCKIGAIRSVEVAKWPQRNPLRLLFQWRGWKSTLSPSFITFSEREPFLRGFLWWNSCNYWSQRCIGVSKTCGRSFVSFWRNLAISEEISWAFSFKFASSSPSVFKSRHSVILCWFHLWQWF